jgi:hypothetical protein
MQEEMVGTLLLHCGCFHSSTSFNWREIKYYYFFIIMKQEEVVVVVSVEKIDRRTRGRHYFSSFKATPTIDQSWWARKR